MFFATQDDVPVIGKDQAEHDTRVAAILERIQAAGATLNPDKCEFEKTCLKFMGHVIDHDGISTDPGKTAVIMHLKSPTISELRKFMGMVNQLGKFTTKLADLNKPLRELLSTAVKSVVQLLQIQEVHPMAHSSAYNFCRFFIHFSYLFYVGHLSLLGLQTKTRRQSNSSTFCLFKSYNTETFMSSAASAFVHATRKRSQKVVHFGSPWMDSHDSTLIQ